MRQHYFASGKLQDHPRSPESRVAVEQLNIGRECRRIARRRAELRLSEAWLLQPGAETNVDVRSFHFTHAATCVSRQERTCACVPAEVSGACLPSVDEVGGFHARLRERPQILAASVGESRAAVLRRREQTRFIVCERRRSGRIPRVIARGASNIALHGGAHQRRMETDHQLGDVAGNIAVSPDAPHVRRDCLFHKSYFSLGRQLECP